MVKDGDLKEIKAKYEKARKKYSLPKFEDIDREFEIRLIDDQGFIIKEIRRAMLTSIQNLGTFFLPVLDPHPHELHSLIEMPAFNKKEREKLFNFYRKLSHLVHKGVSTSIVSEESEADFIKDIWKQWPSIKKEAKGYMDKIIAEWANHRKAPKEDVHYLG
jgi:hypothetical protein